MSKQPKTQKRRPQDDFDEFVNGHWYATNDIPSHMSSWGVWQELQEENSKKLQTILNELDNTYFLDPSSPEAKLRTFYRSGHNINEYYSNNLNSLKGLLAQVKRPKFNMAEIYGKFMKYDLGPINFCPVQDRKNPDIVLLNIVGDGLGLTDRTYYLEKSESLDEIRAEYIDFINTIDEWISLDDPGFDRESSDNSMQIDGCNSRLNFGKKILELETELAKISPSLETLRQDELTYNKMTVGDLKNMSTPEWNWQDWLESTEFSEILDDNDSVIIEDLDFITGFMKLTTKVSPRVWRAYLRFCIIMRFGILIKRKVFHEFFNQMIKGQKDSAGDNTIIIEYINDCLGEILGKLYVQKYFKEESKVKMADLVANLKKAFRKRILNLDWMEQETKDCAINKLEKLNVKIGYPDVWHDYWELNGLREDNLVHNYVTCLDYMYQHFKGQIGFPPDPHDWAMNAHVINAYCDFERNEVAFPAAILQPPFFNPEGETPDNYGAIGAIIGHEITHAFDDQGSKFDGDGRLHDWWTTNDRAEFDRRTQKIVEQFNNITLNGMSVNGELTQGENIADLGGMLTAYDAMLEALNKEGSGDFLYERQEFFRSWAHIWKEIVSEESLRDQILHDTHSPSKLRINVTLSNMTSFHQAFNVKKGDKLYRSEKDIVNIW